MNFLSTLTLARAALFKLGPETANDVALHSLKKLEKAHLADLLGSRVIAPREVYPRVLIADGAFVLPELQRIS
jgi:hypothetical protein